MTPAENQELMQVTNLVMKSTYLSLIGMLENSIKATANKKEKKAYQNVIDWIRKQDQERIDKIESVCNKKQSPILTLSSSQIVKPIITAPLLKRV